MARILVGTKGGETTMVTVPEPDRGAPGRVQDFVRRVKRPPLNEEEVRLVVEMINPDHLDKYVDQCLAAAAANSGTEHPQWQQRFAHA